MVFNIEGKGSVEVTCDNYLSEWYLVNDLSHNPSDGSLRKYVSPEWFHEKLKDDEERIYRFCSRVRHKTDSPYIKERIKYYEKYYDDFIEKEVGDAGMDSYIFMEEVIFREIFQEPTLSWW